MMLLQLKAFAVCFLLLSVVEAARLPRKTIGKNIPLKVLKRDDSRIPHTPAFPNATFSLFEKQTVNMMEKLYTRPSLVGVRLHPNVTKETSTTSNDDNVQSQRTKRSPQCIKAPVIRCEKYRLPECLLHVGCKGAGSCGGTCKELLIPHTVLRYKGESNNVSIWQPDVILLSNDCYCA